jgi:hypothetical protein
MYGNPKYDWNFKSVPQVSQQRGEEFRPCFVVGG